jgi:hypothetical protein
MRNALLALALIAGGMSGEARGGWAAKMFPGGLNHDFGSVPRGAQLFYQFKVKNIYAVPMEITEVKSGCGCVSAEAASTTLAPRGTTTIDVRMDAARFTGHKSVRIRVTVGPKFVSTAELVVSATSRADIVFNPGEVNFGTVVAGKTPSATLDVEYAGALPWKVTGVVTKGTPFDVKLEEWYRRPGQVGYRVHVTLKADALPGALKKDFFLKTNDPATPLVPVLVEGYVQSPLVVVPATLRLGEVPAGKALKRRVVVRGSKPFRITKVEGTGDGITLESPPADKPTLVQTLTFRCNLASRGDFQRVIKIQTDLQSAPVAVTIGGTVQ